jgi:hypothetical protein
LVQFKGVDKNQRLFILIAVLALRILRIQNGDSLAQSTDKKNQIW